MVRKILVGRSLDAANLNAQAKNAQYILRHWQSTAYRPSGVVFSTPDQGVAENPNIDLVRLRSDRFWRAAWFATYLRKWDAIFYPGLHHRADWLGLKARSIIGRQIPVISTLEGLIGETGNDDRERRFAEVAGHPVYCQKIPGNQVRRIEAVYKMARHIIAISPFLARLGVERYGAKVSMLPLGVDTLLFKRTSHMRRRRPRVIGVGNVRSHKRPDLFVDFAKQYPQADFVWFGEGNLRGPLCEEINRSGLLNLKFPGAVPTVRLAHEFSSSDIFILPSLGEGVPKVTQEAAATGLAQIVFGFYETPSVINGRNGLVVWSDEEMAIALGKLIDNPDLVEEMGRQGAAMAASWSWDHVAPQWERRIIDVLENRVAG